MADPLFLLDTNICIYLLHGNSESARRRMEECMPGEVVTSAIAYAEVMVGVRDLGAISASDTFFSIVTVLPFDRPAARAYALLPFKRGRYDRLIAAHARTLNLTLVTNNEIDFADVPGLKVENWTR